MGIHTHYTPTWTPKVHDFEESNSGIQNKNITDTSTALNIFLEFMNEEIINKIVFESNNYYQQMIEEDVNMKQNMRNLGPDEFMCFLGIVLLMSRVKKLEIHEYWSTNILIETPMFAKVMKRDRFKFIMRILHFRNNNEQSSDRLRKISSMTTVLKEILPKNFTPYQNLCIDESLLLFKGRLLFKQYIPSKRSRFGIKMFIISDCKTGYILDFIIYSGSTTEITSNNPELGKSGQIVLMLMNNYLHKGHCLYVDNWYSSPLLFQYLHQQQVNACGTVKKNRKHMIKFGQKLRKGDVIFYSSGPTLAIKWCDKREVHMLTTIHEISMTETEKIDKITKQKVQKPTAVLEYNENMGAVDKSDMMLSSIKCTRKAIKWYKKIFFHLVDICIYNPYILYNIQKKKRTTLADFQLELIEQIFEKHNIINSSLYNSLF
ncbi:piggyBac transposable element-derived protein 4-like [Onthophagus taurus]|uniref:piggyBac transposable element-derived protein 4-like n=1 Tax=Onthophagus taurus TaxID=166361 RepID=UPI0039BDF4B1